MATTQKQDHQAANTLLAKIALGILIFAVVAFALKAIIHPERLVRYTPLVMLHAATMLAWMAVLMSQAWLASKGALAKHRMMGRWSPLLVAATVISGMTVSWQLSQEFNRYDVLIGNTGIMLTFVPFYLVGIYFARQHKAAEHRMAMLLGTLSCMAPAYSRIMDILELPEFAAAPIQLLVVPTLAIWLDRVFQGRVSKSTWIMLGCYFGALIATAIALLSLAPRLQ